MQGCSKTKTKQIEYLIDESNSILFLTNTKENQDVNFSCNIIITANDGNE